jgi:hypothetical protein
MRGVVPTLFIRRGMEFAHRENSVYSATYVGHLWFHSDPDNVQKIVSNISTFLYIVTAYLTVVWRYFCHVDLFDALDPVTTGQTTPYQITGSEANVEEIFLIINFIDRS